MPVQPPAEPGAPISEIDTPALVLELDPLERNLDHMAGAAAAAGVRLRPHAKMHKCAVIALEQIARGAVGVCCQKVSEAEALVHAGVRDVLVSNEIVGSRKLDRLVALARLAHVGVCVDDADNARELSQAAVRAGVSLDVLVEIDVGAHRCGVEPGAPAVRLAGVVSNLPGLRFAGLQAYQGRAQHMRTSAEREVAIERASDAARVTRDALRAEGLSCPLVTGAGTGTYRLEAASGVYGELQAGSYAFMDADYARNLDVSGNPMSEFEHALFVLATVMSRPAPGRAVLDAGLKALSVDSGFPKLVGRPGITFVGASGEHGVLEIGKGAADIALGDQVRLIPGHCDPTVNLHDWYVCTRGGRVEALWPIVARGALQ
jgi:D-serine deaminase-like pyridoxal phosphate-dependent protein